MVLSMHIPAPLSPNRYLISHDSHTATVVKELSSKLNTWHAYSLREGGLEMLISSWVQNKWYHDTVESCVYSVLVIARLSVSADCTLPIIRRYAYLHDFRHSPVLLRHHRCADHVSRSYYTADDANEWLSVTIEWYDVIIGCGNWVDR